MESKHHAFQIMLFLGGYKRDLGFSAYKMTVVNRPLWGSRMSSSGRDAALLYLERADPCSAPASGACNLWISLIHKASCLIVRKATGHLRHTIPH